MTAFSVRDLELERDGFRLGPLTLEFPTGSRTAIVGPSGAGKSTLLRCLASLERPTGGIVERDGAATNSTTQQTPPHELDLGFVFQDGGLWPHMTAAQHLRFANPSLTRADVSAWLDRVGLGGLERRRPAQLSGGEGRRLSLARSLCTGARTLLLDEPLHSLDVHLRDELSLLLRDLITERELTVLVVTHDREEALAMADRLVVMGDGCVVEQGSAVDLLATPTTSWTAVFLGRAARWPAAESPFALPDEARKTGHDHVILPGDAHVTADSPTGTVSGTLLHCEPQGDRWLLYVAVAGQTLRVPHGSPLTGGADVPLALEHVRLLPQTHQEMEL